MRALHRPLPLRGPAGGPVVSRPPRLRLLGAGAVALAVLLSIVGVPVTSAQGTTLFPVRVDRALPVDAPFDAAWDAVAPVDVPLSGQAVVPPMAPQPAQPSPTP